MNRDTDLENLLAEKEAELIKLQQEQRIEAALERVRSRTMAMQKSDELREVVSVVYKELAAVGIDVHLALILIYDWQTKQMEWWSSGHGVDIMPKRYQIQISPEFENHPWLIRYFDAQKKGLEYEFFQLAGEMKRTADDYLFKETDLKSLPESFKEIMRSYEGILLADAFMKRGVLSISVKEELRQEEIDLIKRFAKTIDDTFNRVEELRLAEKQAREALLQAALERVRARSMAMQNSDELLEVSKEMFLQFEGLGIDLAVCGFSIIDPDKPFGKQFISLGGTTFPEPLPIPFKLDPQLKSVYDAWKNGQKIMTLEFKGGKLKSHLNDMLALFESLESFKSLSEVTNIFSKQTEMWVNHGFFKHGYLFVTCFRPLEDIDILVRFAKVFEQTYTRFLDLQKAEAQAREAQIEAALERVRAASMAMHKSEELVKVVRILDKQILGLGIEAWATNIVTDFANPENGSNVWLAVEGQDYLEKFHVPFIKHPSFKKLWTAVRKGVDFYTETYSKADKDEFFKLLYKFSDFKSIPKERQNFSYSSPGMVRVHVLSKNSILTFQRLDLKEFSKEEEGIFKRFGKVFEQAYTRFLDLQKAEAQAREAEIQLALERVRSRSIAMHKSEELADVVALMYTQIQNLGFTDWGCAIILCDEKNSLMRYWYADIFMSHSPEYFHVPLTNKTIKKTWELWEKGTPQFTIELLRKKKDDYTEFMLTETDHVNLPDEVKEGWRSSENVYFSYTNIKYGLLEFTDVEPFGEENFKVYQLFAKVFEQTYTRFLDLKKAEEQALEAQIEAALERVRSRAIAMQNSGELAHVVAILDEEVGKLGLADWGCNIQIMNEKDTEIEIWVSESTKGVLPRAHYFRGEGHPAIKKQWNAYRHREKEPRFVLSLKDDAKRSYDEYAFEFTDFKYFPEEVKAGIRSINEVNFNSAFYKYGAVVAINTTSPLAPGQFDVLARFAAVFEQAYTRFLDLQKAEEQAREAEIQLSLERVRAQTMAMHKTEELPVVMSMIFKQLQELGFDIYSCALILINERKSQVMWMAGYSAEMMPESYEIPYTDHLYFTHFLHCWERQIPYDVFLFEGELKKEYDRYVFEKSDLKVFPDEVKALMMKIDQAFICSAYMKYGWIEINAEEALSAGQAAILHRFSKVFEQTYTRFLDLQKAEEQAREAQIEAALERVRAASMAMHKSEELVKVVRILDKQILGLGIEAWATNIVTDFANPENGSNVWLAVEGQDYLEKFHVPFIKHPSFKKLWTAVRKGVDFYTETYSKADKDEFFKLLYKFSDFKSIPKERQNFSYSSPGMVRVHVLSKNSILTFQRLDLKEFSKEEEGIFKRFGKVFEQAYTRFLDLQKAEAQAREAQIEAALERVRARTMAMHHSEELSETAKAVFEQFYALGNVPDRVSIGIFNEEENLAEVYLTDQLGDRLNMAFEFSLDEPTSGSKLYQAWKRKESTHVVHLFGGELRKWVKYCREKLGLIMDPEKIKDDRFHNAAFFSKGFLLLTTSKQIDEATLQLLSRFAHVFDQTYTRFLDLQKVEKQAREAQIEAALERVRSKSLAMQKSEELNEVVKALYNEFSVLKVNFHVVILQQIIHDSKDMFLWLSAEDGSYNNVIHFPYSGLPLQNAMYKALKNEETVEYTVSGEETREFFEDYFKIKAVPKERMQAVKNVEVIEIIASYQKLTGLTLMRYSEGSYSADEKNIVQRFSKVFEQTYTRFRDLQKAEAQAQATIKQASLDRVRGEIASMRSKEDLNRITPLIWNELTTLGVPFIRCGVFIVNEAKENVEVFLSTPDGKPLGMLNLSFDSNELTSNSIKAWKKSQVYQQHWNKTEFVNWTSSLLEHGQIGNSQEYQGTIEPPEKLDLHFIPFKQGMLYVGSTEALDEETIDMVQSLAKAFAIAYARYEDFSELEKAKQSIETTLSELKATQKQLIQSEKMASLGELTAGIAHEIQNPLNFVNNFSEVSVELIEELREELAPRPPKGETHEAPFGGLGAEILNDLEENLKKINHHGHRASSIVKGMLEHSRTSSGQKELTDINALADEYLRLAYHGLRAKDKEFNAEFKTDFDPNLPKIEVIPQDIGRVLLNLINNAFQAVAEQSAISSRQTANDSNTQAYHPLVTVKTKLTADSRVLIAIEDNGPGIPDEIKDKIFQPFFTTKPTGSGTGLGLSLSYDIVKAHGGELKVESKVGKGSEFVIYLTLNK